MSRFNSWRHGCSSPIRSEARCPPDDRAWQGAAAETTVEQTLMRGSATAGPRFASGLPRSRSGTSVTGPIVDHEGSPPCAAPGHARSWSVMGGWCRPPRCWSRWAVGSGRGRGPDLAGGRPGEGRHLAGDRGGDQVRVLARRDQAAVAGAEPALRLPGDRPYLVRHARLPGDRPYLVRHAVQPGLDRARDARREAVAPGAL